MHRNIITQQGPSAASGARVCELETSPVPRGTVDPAPTAECGSASARAAAAQQTHRPSTISVQEFAEGSKWRSCRQAYDKSPTTNWLVGLTSCNPNCRLTQTGTRLDPSWKELLRTALETTLIKVHSVDVHRACQFTCVVVVHARVRAPNLASSSLLTSTAELCMVETYAVGVV